MYALNGRKYLGAVDVFALFLSLGAPQHKHDMFTRVVDGLHNRIGEGFPALRSRERRVANMRSR